MSVRTITPTELDELCRRGQPVELIDVRTPAEYREVHAEFARSVPLDSLDPRAVMEARNGPGRRAALHDLPLGQPRPAGVREVPGLRVRQRRQRGGRHAGLGAGGPAGRPWQEGDLAGAAGADCRRVAGAARHGPGGLRASGLPRPGRRSSGRAWSSPGSPTPAAWGCCWPGCPGTRPAGRRRARAESVTSGLPPAARRPRTGFIQDEGASELEPHPRPCLMERVPGSSNPWE